MFIQLDLSSGVAPYRQIKQQIKTYIAMGRLKPGDTLPTMRALANDLDINHNTVARAYRELEVEGLLTSRVGSGTFVAHQDQGLTLETRQAMVQAHLHRGVVEGFTLKFSIEEIRSLFESVLRKYGGGDDDPSYDAGPGRVSDASACRCTATEISYLAPHLRFAPGHGR